jgi:hypothetical protein
VETRSELGGLAQRVEELLATAATLEGRPRGGDGLHDISIPGRRAVHLPGE